MVEFHTKTPPEKEEAFLVVLTGQEYPGSPWSVKLSLNGKPMRFEIDTGAEVTVIPPKTHRDIGSPTLYPSTKILRGPSNKPLAVRGQFTAKLRKGKQEVEQKI